MHHLSLLDRWNLSALLFSPWLSSVGEESLSSARSLFPSLRTCSGTVIVVGHASSPFPLVFSYQVFVWAGSDLAHGPF